MSPSLYVISVLVLGFLSAVVAGLFARGRYFGGHSALPGPALVGRRGVALLDQAVPVDPDLDGKERVDPPALVRSTVPR